jgi:DNA invertase Pin-like site-specific DNA recombinase
MKYGYARVSTGGQSLAAQTDQPTQAGAERIVKEKMSGAITERP